VFELTQAPFDVYWTWHTQSSVKLFDFVDRKPASLASVCRQITNDEESLVNGQHLNTKPERLLHAFAPRSRSMTSFAFAHPGSRSFT
jgi:hypothetical protein